MSIADKLKNAATRLAHGRVVRKEVFSNGPDESLESLITGLPKVRMVIGQTTVTDDPFHDSFISVPQSHYEKRLEKVCSGEEGWFAIKEFLEGEWERHGGGSMRSIYSVPMTFEQRRKRRGNAAVNRILISARFNTTVPSKRRMPLDRNYGPAKISYDYRIEVNQLGY